MVEHAPQYQKENFSVGMFPGITLWSSDKSAINVENGGIMLTENPKYSERNLFHCHFVLLKPQVDLHGIELGPAL